jgi:hypothetical protein
MSFQRTYVVANREVRQRPASQLNSSCLMKPASEKAVSEMKTPADGRGRFVSLYFQCSEIGGANWQVSEKLFLSQFQIETRATHGAELKESHAANLLSLA